MDFELSEEQASIAELAGTILGDLCTPDLLRAHEESGEPTLEKAWSALASADLLGVALPEAVGGGGYGIFEACLVAEQVGRHVAPIPFLPTMAGGADAGGHRRARRHPPRRRRRRGRARAPRSRTTDRCRGRRRPTHLLVARDGRAAPRRRRRSGARRHAGERHVGPAGGHRRPRRRRPAPSSVGATRSTLMRRIATALHCAAVDRRVRGGAPHHRGLRRPTASSSARRSARSRPSPSASPTPTSTPRAPGSPRSRRRGGCPRGSPPTRSCTSPSSGRPKPATGSATPPSTCTAASASTSTTRCTATSGGPRCSSCSSATAPTTSAASGALIAAEPA